MDVTPLIPQGSQIIQGYPTGGFKINGIKHDGAVIVFPEKTISWAAPSSFLKIKTDNFAPLFDCAGDIDVVLFGTGARGEFFPVSFRQALKEKDIVVETMDTGAACRTYNVLMAEGRRVVAALMPV